jgi:hypothetical protein
MPEQELGSPEAGLEDEAAGAEVQAQQAEEAGAVSDESEAAVAAEPGADDAGEQGWTPEKEKELENLRALAGRQGKELGELRKATGSEQEAEGGETPKTWLAEDEFGEGRTETEEEAEAEAEGAEAVQKSPFGEYLYKAFVDERFGDIEAAIDAKLNHGFDQRYDERRGAERAFDSQRQRCIDIYGKDLVRKHERTVEKLMQRDRLPYYAAFIVASEGDRIQKATERGRDAATKAANARGGEVAAGGRQGSRKAPKSYKQAIIEAKPTDTERGDFDKL